MPNLLICKWPRDDVISPAIFLYTTNIPSVIIVITTKGSLEKGIGVITV